MSKELSTKEDLYCGIKYPLDQVSHQREMREIYNKIDALEIKAYGPKKGTKRPQEI